MGILALSAYLRTRRHQLGLSQRAVAQAIGIVTDQVSRLERGLHEPDGRTLLGWIAALDAPLADVTALFYDPRASPDDGIALADLRYSYETAQKLLHERLDMHKAANPRTSYDT